VFGRAIPLFKHTMVKSIVTVGLLQPATYCTAACVLGTATDATVLLACCQDSLLVYKASPAGPAERAEEDESAAGQLQLLQRIPMFDVLSALVNVTRDSLLAVTGDGRCLLLSFLEKCHTSRNPAPESGPTAPFTLREHACVQLQTPPCLAPYTRREDGACCSPPLALSDHSDTAYVALSLYHDIVHVLQVRGPQDGVDVQAFDLKRQALLGLKPGKD